MLNFDKINKIFIDFDGVIVDSNKFKENAIENSICKLFNKNEYIINAINYFNLNAGVARKKKLLLFFKDEEVSKIMKIYSQDCKEFFNSAYPSKGLEDFLKYIKRKHKHIKFFVLSGGEKDEIKIFLNKNNLLGFFEDILASDKNKIDHLKNENVSENDIFIGDSITDLKASLESNIKFVLFEEYKSLKSFPNNESTNRNVFLKTRNFQTFMDKIK